MGGPVSKSLMEVEVKVVTKETCMAAMGNDTITDGMLCAGGEEGFDACQVG